MARHRIIISLCKFTSSLNDTDRCLTLMLRTRPAIYCVQLQTTQAGYSKQTRRLPYLIMIKQNQRTLNILKSSAPSLTLVNYTQEDIKNNCYQRCNSTTKRIHGMVFFFQTFQRLTMNDIDQRYLLLTVILSDKEHTMFDRIDLVTIF